MHDLKLELCRGTAQEEVIGFNAKYMSLSGKMDAGELKENVGSA